MHGSNSHRGEPSLRICLSVASIPARHDCPKAKPDRSDVSSKSWRVLLRELSLSRYGVRHTFTAIPGFFSSGFRKQPL